MKCVFKNIYNIKLLEENILLIGKEKKTSFKHVFLLTKPKHVFFVFENKNCFSKFSSQTQFFF